MKTLAICALTLVACSKDNPYYCANPPCETTDAGQTACETSDDCDSPTPVCAAHVCVTCADGETDACTGTTPVCSNQSCTACVAHGQCASDVCLGNGACAMPTEVAYVSSSGSDAGDCTLAAPCQKITTAATKARPYVRVMGNLDEAVLLDNVTVTVLADAGTYVMRTSVGPVVEVRGTSNVVIQDLIVRSGLGSTGHGVYVAPGEASTVTLDHVAVLNNAGVGVNVLGGSLTVKRSVVSGNTAGGAIVSASFNITNSMFVTNGGNLSTTGGLTLTPAGTSDMFRFNTVADNLSSSGSVSVRGLNCTLPMVAASTIISGNAVSSNCTFDYSLFDTGTTTTGTNRNGNAMFKSVDALSPMSADFFHIQPGSDAIDGADPAEQLMIDIDGDARPNGNGRDIGADEYK